MSGLEAIGIAASIIQVAELGTKLAVKLCTFYRQVKESNEAVQSLSSDVSLTCSILHQLGDSLKQDAETQLYSAKAFITAQEILGECRKVFDKIDHAVEEQKRDNTKNRVARVTRKFGLALMERDLDVMRTNLERLKSTMLLMLNVIIYAGQIRSESPLLKEQRELINILVAEKKANEDKYANLQKAIQSAQVNNHFQALSPSISRDTASTTSTAYDPSTELQEYYTLFRDLLDRVDACKYTFEPSRHRRIRNGVMDLNLAEAPLFQSVNRQKPSQLARGDSISESHRMHTPAQTNKKRKAQPAPAYFGSDDGSPAACYSPCFSFEPDFSGIKHPAADIISEHKTTPQSSQWFKPPSLMYEDLGHVTERIYGDHDGEPLLYQPGSWGGSGGASHSVDNVSDVVEDVILEWTTIDRGELLG
ncbi:hypothetical protein SI65_03313 [Aspergillus cristatus]|uniref:Fungal N-terminal domain-containing protein n=1 Tax=Aspergillus cristatus TaxID=573508 RepID=A0A1E3BH19_ASPCR|nr:hypothetical protein SI65_03313 [Aspergillus cristatus]